MSRIKTNSKDLRRHTKKYVKEVEERNEELENIIDELNKEISEKESRLDHLIDAFNAYYDNYHGMKTYIEDLASHGTRFDTNPTIIFSNDVKETISDLYKYIQRIDESIKQRAKEIKEVVDKIEKEKGL
jgi:DNA repair exonuclease SbcCD ATPase subunit